MNRDRFEYLSTAFIELRFQILNTLQGLLPYFLFLVHTFEGLTNTLPCTLTVELETTRFFFITLFEKKKKKARAAVNTSHFDLLMFGWPFRTNLAVLNLHSFASIEDGCEKNKRGTRMAFRLS